jgi:hypothetical protein
MHDFMHFYFNDYVNAPWKAYIKVDFIIRNDTFDYLFNADIMFINFHYCLMFEGKERWPNLGKGCTKTGLCP